ncbi:hypothetical protein [Halobellus salinisoli]|uniref:hypothetical protein n=1 Tax=Halobellus salinisoli TaxID=3108500 RepID=UPI003007FB16
MLGGAFALVVLLFAVAVPLVLYALVRAEHDRRETMDRREGERAARRDAERASSEESRRVARSDSRDR